MKNDLTSTERRILQAIWDDEEKAIDYSECRKAAAVTNRGFRTIFYRLQYRSLLTYQTSGDRNRVTITLAGMRALGVTLADARQDELPEIDRCPSGHHDTGRGVCADCGTFL